MQEFLDANDCCLGPFGRAFRVRFPTPEALRSREAASAILFWQRGLMFTTAPAECEHKSMKDEMASTGI